MALGLWPALGQGEGRRSIEYGGCCGAPLLIRVLSPRLEFIRSIRGSWVCLGHSHICTCMSLLYLYGCVCSCVSSRASFWANFVLGDESWGSRLQAGTQLLHRTGSCMFT